jgi:hypothetical protein
MRGVLKSNKNIELIDLTKNDNVKEEPLTEDHHQSFISRYTCKISIENNVSLLHPGFQLIFFVEKLKELFI